MTRYSGSLGTGDKRLHAVIYKRIGPVGSYVKAGSRQAARWPSRPCSVAPTTDFCRWTRGKGKALGLGDMGACGSKEAATAVVVTAEGNTAASPAAPPSHSVKLTAPLPPPEAQPLTSTADGGGDLDGAEDKDTVTPVSTCELF
jgi:hypothetical protein